MRRRYSRERESDSLPPFGLLSSFFLSPVLSNDHKELTDQMEELLHQLHAISREPGTATPSAAAGPSDAAGAHVGARPIADPLAVPARSTRPFAEIDEVNEGSPGAAAGLQVGDLVVRFGHVTAQTPNWLQAVAGLLGESEGKAIEAGVRRDGGKVTLTLVPQQWSGRGLLGAHMAALR